MNRFAPNLGRGDFHHALPIYGIQNIELQEKVFCDIITLVLYDGLLPVYLGRVVQVSCIML